MDKTLQTYQFYADRRDRYLPDAPLWLTETAEAACGGNPWAKEYVDVFRYVSQLGKLARRDVDVVMHNTLTASDYGLLDECTHAPRPNYWVAWLWRQLMGTQVYDPGSEAGRVEYYLHGHPQRTGAKTLLVLNPTADSHRLELPRAAEAYVLTPAGDLHSQRVLLNGRELRLTDRDNLPELGDGVRMQGPVEQAGYSLGFYVFE